MRTSNPLADICNDIRGRERGGGVREKFAKICVQPLLHKSLTIKQPKKGHKQTTVNKLRQGKLREITKCLLTLWQIYRFKLKQLNKYNNYVNHFKLCY